MTSSGGFLYDFTGAPMFRFRSAYQSGAHRAYAEVRISDSLFAYALGNKGIVHARQPFGDSGLLLPSRERPEDVAGVGRVMDGDAPQQATKTHRGRRDAERLAIAAIGNDGVEVRVGHFANHRDNVRAVAGGLREELINGGAATLPHRFLVPIIDVEWLRDRHIRWRRCDSHHAPESRSDERVDGAKVRDVVLLRPGCAGHLLCEFHFAERPCDRFELHAVAGEFIDDQAGTRVQGNSSDSCPVLYSPI